MTPGEFLRAVWPVEGIYCIATPFTKPDGGLSYAQRTFDDISGAVSCALTEAKIKDVYFATHALKAHNVWNPDKLNWKTGERGANEVRVQRNMRAARCFFFDLDVGSAVNKYSTQAEAGADLIRFCKVTSLPKPLVISSGGGLHVYWLLTDAIESEEWRVTASKLKQLAHFHGFKVDGSRTTDTASVLRVAGTFNYKDRANPRPVAALTAATETGTGAFVQLVDRALIEAGVTPLAPPRVDAMTSILGSNTDREFKGPPMALWPVLRACGQMRRLATAKGDFTEPEWYHGVIGIGRFLEDGHRRVQQMSQGYKDYTPEATKLKTQQHEAQSHLGPTSCAKLLEVSREADAANEDICRDCPVRGDVEKGKIRGPLGAARFKNPAAAPTVTELVGSGLEPVVTEIPLPPEPFMRLNGGGIAVVAKNADGDETNSIIYEHDLYPIRRVVNAQHGTEQLIWHVSLPRGEEKDFTLDADMLYDPRKFTTAIANQGIYPEKGHISTLQEYMVAYIAKLQKQVTADAQCNHLGWLDDYKSFVLPDKILCTDGTAKVAQLSLGVQRSSAFIGKRGELKRQVELMEFYNHPEYIPNQVCIVASAAATLFYNTGHHGVIINASGDAGAFKSTTLYSAASLWGQPELYTMNGTNNGATVRGRNERVTVMANLPICVDEITNMPVKDAIDLAMSITQPGHRIRLQTDGVERANLGSYKSTIMISTGNNSLHGLLSTDNAAGTAGSMRVFEIRFQACKVHTKAEADDYLHDLKENYGHIGEQFITNVMPRTAEVSTRIREMVRQVDQDVGIQSSERFYSATIADILVSNQLANEMGLLHFPTKDMKEWLYDVQMPHMRGVVKEEYSDPLGIVSDYLEMISPNMLVVQRMQSDNKLVNLRRKPTGALLAHYDMDDHMLYVLKKGFKDHCARIGANSLKVLEDLYGVRDGARIVPTPHTRRTLGAGTEFAKGQSWCFAINTAHPEVSGTVALEVLTGGGQSSANMKAPELRVIE